MAKIIGTTMINLKTWFIWEKKKHAVISEMSWCNVLRKADSNYYVNNFPCTFVDFRFKKFTQETISSYADPCQ